MSDERRGGEPDERKRDPNERAGGHRGKPAGAGRELRPGDDRAEHERIEADAFAARLVALFIKGGPITIPRARRDQLILLKAIALTLNPTREYSEFEINAAIQEWLAVVALRVEADHVTLRRMLVDEGFLARDGYGAIYTVATTREATRFAPDVDAVDVWKVIDEARRAIAGRRAARR